MDISKFKSVVPHDGNTVLLTFSDGFDAVTGKANPDKEIGMQRGDVAAMLVAAENAADAAEAALLDAYSKRDDVLNLVNAVDAIPRPDVIES